MQFKKRIAETYHEYVVSNARLTLLDQPLDMTENKKLYFSYAFI
jgi:hypothetical protein